MESWMHSAIVRMKTERKLDETLLKERSERYQWRKRLTRFANDGEELVYDRFKTPSEQQVEQCLQPVRNTAKNHIEDLATLAKALTDHSFVMPKFTGALETVCLRLDGSSAFKQSANEFAAMLKVTLITEIHMHQDNKRK